MLNKLFISIAPLTNVTYSKQLSQRLCTMNELNYFKNKLKYIHK